MGMYKDYKYEVLDGKTEYFIKFTDKRPTDMEELKKICHSIDWLFDEKITVFPKTGLVIYSGSFWGDREEE